MHFINPYTFTWFRARVRVRAKVRASKGVFFTEAPAEFQHHSHVNCMNLGSQDSCMLC